MQAATVVNGRPEGERAGARHGALLAQGYLRPWAVRAVHMAGAPRGEVALDVMCDSGVATDELSRCGATATGVDTAHEVVVAAAAQVRPGTTIRHVAASRLPFDNGTVSAVVSLFALGFAPSAAGVVREIRRVLAPGGGVAIMLWSPDCSAERLLADALATFGIRSPFLSALLAPDLGDTSWLDEQSLRDVARFDGIEQFWIGMVMERPLAGELLMTDPVLVARVRERCAELLAPHTAADGTLRIPVEARCLTQQGLPALAL